MTWKAIETAPKDGSRVLCWGPGFEHPEFLIWKTNPRIQEEADLVFKNVPPLSASYFGDPDEMDDYDLAVDGGKPTLWFDLPEPPT